MISIRKATRRDYSGLVKIMNDSADKKELEGFVPPKNETRKFLLQLRQHSKLAGHGVFVAEINQKPVGFIYFIQEKHNFSIEEVDVAKKHQGQGIGRALVERVEKLAKHKGANYSVTGTAIDSRGTPWKAYWFWTHMGYTDTGGRTDSGYEFKYCKLLKKLQ
jgi:GNAT superfamily N-acetyltransferase